MRPDIGTQDKFRKKKPAATYRYDSSLSPALDWDGQNGARELGEWLLGLIKTAAALPPPHRFDTPQQFTAADGRVQMTVQSLQEAVDALTRLGKPFLTWAGKAERLSFDVPTLPLFVHERLSTRAIVDTLIGHKKDKQQSLFDLFGDPQHSIADQVMRAYEHQDRWVNRMILGDSLVVMNSLLQYEGLGGQVQGKRRQLTAGEDPADLPAGLRLFRPNPLTSQTGRPTTTFPVQFAGRTFAPRSGGWKTDWEHAFALFDSRKTFLLFR